MIIQQSSIAMASRQEFYMRHSRQESLTVWRDRPAANAPTDTVSLSQEAKKIAPTDKATLEEELPISDKDKMEMELIRRMVEMLTGRKLRMVTVSDILKAREEGSKDAEEMAAAIRNRNAPAENGPEGWGMIHQISESHYEEETTAFAATGKVTTADGQEIDIAVELTMSRQFMEENNLEVRAGDAARLQDPLVINYGGTAASLTERSFKFDLDSDGQADQISFVGGGSGLLSLDKNKDGVINDGKELFGPSSGDGFAELSRHDQDGNQWIDENDAVYDKLRIWSKTADGQDQLFALGEKGIGALYLGRVASEFSIKDTDNQLLGQVRSTGLYLRENGGAGTVQQIDLAVG
ncbi:MAG: hypothetical protein G8345_13535 [Magnetococcales bacterium]|nr:hypothetical protein [Magnetococcales bacterium]NGZ27896.1 hypothetical protein [Magnetococcales bacterium]